MRVSTLQDQLLPGLGEGPVGLLLPAWKAAAVAAVWQVEADDQCLVMRRPAEQEQGAAAGGADLEHGSRRPVGDPPHQLGDFVAILNRADRSAEAVHHEADLALDVGGHAAPGDLAADHAHVGQVAQVLPPVPEVACGRGQHGQPVVALEAQKIASRPEKSLPHRLPSRNLVSCTHKGSSTCDWSPSMQSSHLRMCPQYREAGLAGGRSAASRPVLRPSDGPGAPCRVRAPRRDRPRSGSRPAPPAALRR